MERGKLIDVFSDWNSGGGIFSILQSFDIPWKDENISVSLDLEYYGNISGEKYISPLVEKVKSGETLTPAEKGLIATSIMAIYGRNWGKLWDTLEFEYNPIENYSMTEIMTNDETVMEYGKTHSRTDNLSHNKTGTETDTPNTTETRTDNLTVGASTSETVTPNTTETTTPNLTNNVNNSVFGFNSSSAVNTGASSTTETGSTTITKTGTESKSGSKSETNTGTQTLAKTGTDQREYNTHETDTGTVNDSDGGHDTHTRNYNLTRSGNIGVTTSQQMIESERKLWLWNFFRTVVFPDIDRVLTLSIY